MKKDALMKLGLDEDMAKKLEEASIKTIESGIMTKDLIDLFNKKGINKRAVNSKEFLVEISKKYESL